MLSSTSIRLLNIEERYLYQIRGHHFKTRDLIVFKFWLHTIVYMLSVLTMSFLSIELLDFCLKTLTEDRKIRMYVFTCIIYSFMIVFLCFVRFTNFHQFGHLLTKRSVYTDIYGLLAINSTALLVL